MSSSSLRPHDIQLASTEGERMVLLLLWNSLAAVAARMAGVVGRGIALMPGSRSLG